MSYFNLGQNVANLIEKNLNVVAKSNPLWQADRMRRYGSLININPSACIYHPSCTCTGSHTV